MLSSVLLYKFNSFAVSNNLINDSMKKNILLFLVLLGMSAKAQVGTETLGTTVTPQSNDPAPYNGTTTLNAPGSALTTGDYNTLIGDGAGSNLTTADQSVFIGTGAGALHTNDSDNVVIGAFAADQSTDGTDNVIIGTRAGRTLSGTDNVVIGTEAGMVMTNGASDNTLIGEEAGQALIDGDDNTFLGEDAGFNTTTASDNTFLGSTAGRTNTTGYRNVFVGSDAGYDNTTGYRNTFVGDSTGVDVGVGRLNTFVGQGAGSATEHANYNTFIGTYAGGDNNRVNNTNDANRNTYVGVFTGYTNRNGEDNVGMGAFSDYRDYSDSQILTIKGRGNVSGNSTPRSRTTFLGAQAYANNNDVILLGYRTRVDGARGMALGTESYVQRPDGIALGYQAQAIDTMGIAIGKSALANAKNSYAIGADAQALKPNTMILGGATNPVSVGIATDVPNDYASLELAANNKGLLLNRMPTIERTNLAANLTPGEEGLLVYDFEDDAMYTWNGTAWVGGIIDTDTDNQTIDTFALVGNELQISLEDDGNPIETVDLSAYVNTDSQNLLAATLTGTVVDIDIENGTSVSVDLAPLLADLENRVTVLEACECNTLPVEEYEGGRMGPVLHQNIPNPFDGTSAIKYYIPYNMSSNAHIVFSNGVGQIINTVELSQKGENEIYINSSDYSSGMYYYTLYIGGSKIDTKKMIVE